MRYVEHAALIIVAAAIALPIQACAPAAKTSASPLAPAAAQTLEPRPSPEAALPPLPADPVAQARALTDYLKAHRLPLVGANVVVSGGQREVILYGFVATAYGKRDAEQTARRFMRDPNVEVANRVIVAPQLLAASSASTAGNGGTGAGNGQNGGQDIFDRIASQPSYPAPDQSGNITAYQQSQQPGSSGSPWVTILMTLLMIAPMFIP